MLRRSPYVEYEPLTDIELPELPFFEVPSLGIVDCPNCESDEAVVVTANYGDKGCYCPECEHVWVERARH